MSFFDKAKAAATDLAAKAKGGSKPKHTYKFTYFNLRGLGEIARLLFAVGEQEYEDDRVKFEVKADGTYDQGDWPERKKAMPFGKIPVLTVDGKQVIAQSKAIERFLARSFDLYGSNDIEAAEIEMYGEQLIDLRNAFHGAGMKDTAAKELKHEFKAGESYTDKYWATTLPESIAILEAVVAKSGSKDYFVGSKLSLVDIQFFHVLTSFSNQEALNKALAAAPTLTAIQKKVAEHPKIVEWLAKRPQTVF